MIQLFLVACCLCRSPRAFCSEGPTGRKRVKSGVSGPAEDLRPVSEVEAAVNYRPPVAGAGRCAVPDRRPGPGSRRSGGGAVTPSLHPEVSDTQSVSPGRGDRVSSNRWLDEGVQYCKVGDLGAKG